MKLYDNGGVTVDRYTVVLKDGSVYGMSDNATSPEGFNQFVGIEHEMDRGALGIEIADIPDELIKAIAARI